MTLALPDQLEAIVFDVGETLVDETRHWSELADAAGLTRLTVFGALGALIERGADHRELWATLDVPRPGPTPAIEPRDLYADALPCLRAAADAGVTVGIAGNQPETAEAALRALKLPVSFTASSAGWGVEKPSAAFFARVAEAAAAPPERIAYVGDRLDNDVLPALAAGMYAVLVRRGPWGHLHARRPEAARADAVIDSLQPLTAALIGSRGSHRASRTPPGCAAAEPAGSRGTQTPRRS